jgi:hypothetical protein
MKLLTNEERLSRLRARWHRQQEARKRERVEIPKPTCGLKTGGVYRERLITPAMMRMGEQYFWGKRGIASGGTR